MRKVLVYSVLLVVGLLVSQVAPQHEAYTLPVRLLTMAALSFIMIHVGYEFEVDKSRPTQYAWDYVVAGTAAAFPWIFCAAYFMYAMSPPELWTHPDQWKTVLLEARFSSPTSAGVLFSMLAAAGLGATWLFHKARVLAIFDDLDTILLMIPLTAMMLGPRWQLGIVVVVLVGLLWLAWRFLHELRWPITWPWVLTYAAGITALSELFYLGSKWVDRDMPIHLEVLLPAFVLGCMLARPAGADPHADDAREGVEEGPEAPNEQRVSTIVSACFMVLVGLSMPPIRGTTTLPTDAPVSGLSSPAQPGSEQTTDAEPPVGHVVLSFEGVAPDVLAEKDAFPGWGTIGLHVLAITVLSNIGKMFPMLCYRREASLRERVALSIGMFPRGEVGAGVLVISLGYGLGGPILTVAVLSLALNLLGTGLFIVVVKRLLAHGAGQPLNPATAGVS